MRFTDQLKGNIAVFELSGKIMDAEDTTQFRGRIHELLDLNVRKFVIDMSRVEWITSVGLGMLIRANQAVCDSGGSLALAKVEGKSEQLMTITRLSTKIHHYDTSEEAIAAMSQ